MMLCVTEMEIQFQILKGTMEFDKVPRGRSDSMMMDFVQESRLTLMQRRVTKY